MFRDEHSEWFDIIPGFHCREGSGGSLLLYAEVEGMTEYWVCLYTWPCLVLVFVP